MDNYLKDHDAPEDINFHMCVVLVYRANAVKGDVRISVLVIQLFFDDFGGSPLL